MKKTTPLSLLLAAALLALPGCGSNSASGSAVDSETSATAIMLSLDESVCVRAGTTPEGELLLDGTTMEGFFASDHYTEQSPYGFALVLTNEGKKNFRNATRELAKEQSAITLWANGEAVCSPVITSMLNTNYVILNIASVQDAESYDTVVALLSEKNT